MDTPETSEQDRPEEEVDQTTPEEQQAEDLKKLNRKIKWKQGLFKTADLGILAGATGTILIALFTAIPLAITLFMGNSFNTVLTGSMSGSIETGDVVITAQYNGQGLNVGQVIGVNSATGRYLHRIVDVNEDGTYTTRGDANDVPDLLKPDASPGSEDIWGVLTTVHHQPFATYISMFALDLHWTSDMAKALSAKKFDVAFGLLATAPWGWLILLASAFLFMWLLPDLRDRFRDRAARRDYMALEALKQQVANHEGSLTELEPVVDELKQDHDAAKAKEEEEARAFREALEAPLSYDPDNLFDEPESTDDADDADAFLRELQARHGTTGLTTRSSQNELPALIASTPDGDEPEQRSESSAFDMDEIDDIRELIK